MTVTDLLQWQWNSYQKYHRSRVNLLIHIVVVPLFLAGNIGIVFALAQRSWVLGIASLVAMIVSVALQGRGHGKEENPPAPFTGPDNAIARIFLEQWINFPRFVISGGWYRALRS